MIKKTLFVLFLTPLILAALLIIAVIAVLNWPTIVVNPTTLEMAARHISPLGIHAEWKEVHAGFESHGLMDKALDLIFEDLCIRYSPVLEKSCLGRVELHARYVMDGFFPRLIAFGPTVIEDGVVTVNIPVEEEKDKKKGDGRIPLPLIELPKWLHHVDFYPARIGLNEVVINSGETSFKIKIDAEASTDDAHESAAVIATGSAEESPSGRTYRFDVSAESPSGFRKDDWQAKIKASAAMGPAGSASIDADFARGERQKLEHRIEFSYAGDGFKTDAGMEGVLDKDLFETKLTASVQGISEIIPSISIPQCALKLKAKDIKRNRGELTLDCPVDLNLKKFVLSSEMKKIYQPPERVRIDVSSVANTFFKPDLNRKTDGSIKIRVQPSHSKLVSTKGDLNIDFSGIPAQDPDTWHVESDVDIDFIIDHFSELVKVMGSTKYPVPAPFNVLDGQIEFALNGHISSVAQLAHFPAKLSTRLKSKQQKIDIDSEGEVTFGFDHRRSKGSALKLDVSLVDVQLQLPNIEIADIPRFTPDGRILLTSSPKEKEESSVPFEYEIHIATLPNTPLRILSNFTPKYIPVQVDVVLKNEGASGSIAIMEFPIELFSREATISKLNFDLKEPIDMTVVDGSMSVPFPELRVIVAMHGPIAEPAIMLDSDPPMPQGDILSTLLYGDPLANIDSDQASSVNNMSAAMANRAMALTSFFLLGSTPIQSIAYNPQTGMFTAKVKLASKTSLVVGTSTTEKSAMIQQRLGKGFSISAGADKSDDSANYGGTAYIEWSKRF